MAVDAKLRMSIVTALDNAGIKATEDQINGLAKSMQKVNKEASDNKLANALGGVQGPLGKIGKALSGMPGQIFAIVGAFQTGYEIGTKFFDTVVRGWFGWEDAVSKLKKSNRELNKWLTNNAYTFDQSTQNAIALQDKQLAKYDAAIAKINAQTQAYTRLHKAQSDFANAGEDIDIQQLERERFEDILALQASGDYEAAEQANKIYDIYRQQLDAKKQLANYDEETARFEEERAAKEQEAFKWLEKIDKLQEKRKDWEARLKQLDDDVEVSAEDYDRLQKPILANIASIDKRLASANAQAEKYASELDAGDLESLARERNRAVLVDQSNLNRDKLLWDYGQSIDRAGTDYGLTLDKDFDEQSYKASMESYMELKSIKDNTENLAEKLDILLQMK